MTSYFIGGYRGRVQGVRTPPFFYHQNSFFTYPIYVLALKMVLISKNSRLATLATSFYRHQISTNNMGLSYTVSRYLSTSTEYLLRKYGLFIILYGNYSMSLFLIRTPNYLERYQDTEGACTFFGRAV